MKIIRVEDIVASLGYADITDSMAEISISSGGMLVRNFKNIFFVPSHIPWVVRTITTKKRDNPYIKQTDDTDDGKHQERLMAHLRLIDESSNEKSGLALFVVNTSGNKKSYEELSIAASDIVGGIFKALAEFEEE